MRIHRLVITAAASAACTAAAAADIINLNTGAAGSAWQVRQTTGPSANSAVGLNVDGPAVPLTGTLPFAAVLPGFEAFAWANPFGGAVWVGQLATDGQFTNGGSITCGSPCGAVGGDYVYSYSFASGAGGSLVLSGFTGDNGVRLLTVMQGASELYRCSAGGPGTLCASTQNQVTASTGTLNFGSGSDIVITAQVQNLDGPGRNPSGFILSGSAQVTPVPETGTAALMVAGLMSVAGWIRRQQRRV